MGLNYVVKQVALDGINSLPDDSTWDDIMYFLYVNQKIEKGLLDIENGSVHNEPCREARLLWRACAGATRLLPPR